MKFDWWTLALQALNALILIWLLSRVLYRPVARVIAERGAAAAKLLADAGAERERARRAADAVAAQQAEIAAARDAALAAAEAEAHAARTHMLAAVQADADRLRRQALAELDRLRSEQQRANDERAAALAIDIAAKLLERLPAALRVGAFVDGLATMLRALPPHQRRELADADMPLELVVPRPLEPDELQACTAAVNGALERHVPLEPVVDAALIAGVELRSRSLVVSNHWRADLARLHAALQRAAEHG
ncbi:MAG TPA: F0F1 ATP synthase subunit B [Rubrivivax sp.]|nr:F0F1 ATP synthase subunit B [Rubrivivax sp.]HPO17728.1 F0F1 ATP synthase subunit B [Rubrivivax sp.]